MSCLFTGGLANLLLIYTQVHDADPARVSEVGPGLKARPDLHDIPLNSPPCGGV